MLSPSDPHSSQPLEFYPVEPRISSDKSTVVFGRRNSEARDSIVMARGENGSYYGVADVGGSRSAFRRDANGDVAVLSQDVEDGPAMALLQEAHRAVAMSGAEPVSMRWPVPSSESGRTWRLSALDIPVTVVRSFGALQVTPLAPGAVGFRVDSSNVPAFLRGEFVPPELSGDAVGYFSNGVRADLLGRLRDVPGLLSRRESFDARMTVALLRMAQRTPAGHGDTLDGVKSMLSGIGDKVRPTLDGGGLGNEDAASVVADLRVLMRGANAKVFGADGEAFVDELITPVLQRAIKQRPSFDTDAPKESPAFGAR
jgi:hypothetical protein